jgi:L-ascorbate metabolism protein UlaG (beta-lactamase superfamily)
MTIELTTWGHSGVRLQRGDQRLTIDPGSFTDPRALDDAAAVLITHEHPDHVDPQALAAIVNDRPDLRVWAPESVTGMLLAAGADEGRVHAVAPGQEFTAAGFHVAVLGGTHAVIHPTLPTVANAAYLVEGVVLHPGDSFTPAPDGTRVQVLALPVSAPWLKLAEAVDYAARVAPALAVPIHDAILSDVGRALVDRVADGLTPDLTYRRLELGEALTV